LQGHAQHILLVLIVASLVVGNLGAIMQKNIKRMLGYSAIAHVGFLFMGLLTGPSAGYTALLTYLFIYAFTILAAFAVLILLSKTSHECEKLQDLQGLSKTNPWLAFFMLIAMFSLAGIPPTVGFYAKLVILQSLIDGGYLWLAVFSLVWSVVGAFYYLRVIKFMYFDSPVTEQFPPLVVHKVGPSYKHARVLSWAHGTTFIALSLFPAPLFLMAKWALT
jgi:NADH-quinone oxidoreductase subunit N